MPGRSPVSTPTVPISTPTPPAKPKLLDHVRKDVNTTMIYTHVLNRGGQGVVSPLDRM
jgi:hypothetical protein